MKLIDRMKWYPAVTVIVWVLPTALRIGEVFDWYSYSLATVAHFIVYLQGFVDCVVYVATSPVMSMWKENLGFSDSNLLRGKKENVNISDCDSCDSSVSEYVDVDYESSEGGECLHSPVYSYRTSLDR